MPGCGMHSRPKLAEKATYNESFTRYVMPLGGGIMPLFTSLEELWFRTLQAEEGSLKNSRFDDTKRVNSLFKIK